MFYNNIYYYLFFILFVVVAIINIVNKIGWKKNFKL